MSIKSAVIGIVLAAFASQAVADLPDGKGGRTSVQASKQQVGSRAPRKCCEKTLAGNCKELIVAEAKGTIEPRIPPQRTSVVATPLRCKHMPAAGGIEPRVPPLRAAATPEPTAHRACCENARCKSHVA